MTAFKDILLSYHYSYKGASIKEEIARTSIITLQLLIKVESARPKSDTANYAPAALVASALEWNFSCYPYYDFAI